MTEAIRPLSKDQVGRLYDALHLMWTEARQSYLATDGMEEEFHRGRREAIDSMLTELDILVDEQPGDTGDTTPNLITHSQPCLLGQHRGCPQGANAPAPRCHCSCHIRLVEDRMTGCLPLAWRCTCPEAGRSVDCPLPQHRIEYEALSVEPEWNMGCSCGWRGMSDDVEDHPCGFGYDS